MAGHVFRQEQHGALSGWHTEYQIFCVPAGNFGPAFVSLTQMSCWHGLGEFPVIQMAKRSYTDLNLAHGAKHLTVVRLRAWPVLHERGDAVRRENVCTQDNTREVPSVPMRENVLAQRPLPICCVCTLIRDETRSHSDREHWVTPRTFRKIHGANPDDLPVTHTYCPECFKKAMGVVKRHLRKSCRSSPIPEMHYHAKGGTMTHEPTELVSRIQWCRLQQLHSITSDERAGWRAEEAGLVDALGCRDRLAFMRKEHKAQFTRYLCGLEDGQAILRLSTLTPCDKTHTVEGGSPDSLTSQVKSRPSQPARPEYVAFRG
jgi:hypothetical protein